MNDKANYEIEVWMINEDCNWNSPEAKKDVVEEIKPNWIQFRQWNLSGMNALSLFEFLVLN